MKAMIKYNEKYGYSVDLIIHDNKNNQDVIIHTSCFNKTGKQWAYQQALLKQEFDKNKGAK